MYSTGQQLLGWSTIAHRSFRRQLDLEQIRAGQHASLQCIAACHQRYCDQQQAA